MQTITLINEKGGVGKTTLSTHLAAGLAIRGHRVLLIDTDAQAHSTYALGLPEFGGVYRLIVQDADWKDVLRAPDPARWAGDYIPEGSLFLLPSNIETRGIPQLIDDVAALSERLDELTDYVDVVVIDTPPTPSLFHAAIYHATDGVIFPAECEALALDGLAKSAVRMKRESGNRERMERPPLRLIGVQPNMLDIRTNAHQYGLSQITSHFGERYTLPAIAARTAWRDAAYEQRLLFASAPGSPAELEAWTLVDRVQSEIEVKHG